MKKWKKQSKPWASSSQDWFSNRASADADCQRDPSWTSQFNLFIYLQGFIVTSPQLTNNNDLIATLGTRYPPGTSFTIVPGKPH